ncbi:MAG: hypothetical protein PHV30_07515 [Candidatus Margulisbacteria bacterium]|nr:hypothetical protein [Candidatus Margulisiibacteriota bacterium]
MSSYKIVSLPIQDKYYMGDPLDDGHLLDVINRIQSKMTYSNLERFMGTTHLLLDYEKNETIFLNFNRPDCYPGLGSCEHLYQFGFEELKKSDTNYQVLRVSGEHPIFSQHNYLLIARQNSIKQDCINLDFNNSEKFLNILGIKDMLLWDPSFAFAGLFEPLVYKIKLIYNEQVMFHHETDLTLEHLDSFPLFMDNEKIISLTFFGFSVDGAPLFLFLDENNNNIQSDTYIQTQLIRAHLNKLYAAINQTRAMRIV